MDTKDAREIGSNITRMLLAVGGWVHLETLQGDRRQGRLSGWVCIDLEFNGTVARLPTELELNGDPMDTIRLSNIKELKTIDPPKPK